eukprot:TRINITY_DN231910_c0_g1_i1.p1 TRINITY_DN231910_c0_g1~~TRINITY_DN231910_c0_g1_i1.p1  ORF type:complete len:135 (+),score=18.83 TRINITY_DN231910_c0_g1_i1:88-492(+)
MSSFVIVQNDQPIFEVDFSESKDHTPHLTQFILHSSLDMLDQAIWSTSASYLKVVDRFNDTMVSAFTSVGRTKFLLLHSFKNEEGIRSFFNEVHELYLTIEMNPFYEKGSPITSKRFVNSVKEIANKWFSLNIV